MEKTCPICGVVCVSHSVYTSHVTSHVRWKHKRQGDAGYSPEGLAKIKSLQPKSIEKRFGHA